MKDPKNKDPKKPETEPVKENNKDIIAKLGKDILGEDIYPAPKPAPEKEPIGPEIPEEFKNIKPEILPEIEEPKSEPTLEPIDNSKTTEDLSPHTNTIDNLYAIPDPNIDFEEEFIIARDKYGPNNIFMYKGEEHSTNMANEPFTMTTDALNKRREEIKREDVIEKISYVKDKYKDEDESDGYRNFEKTKDIKRELNSLENIDKINNFYKEGYRKGKYIIVDKKAEKYHIYQDGNLLDSYEGIFGANKGDQQTITVVGKDREGNRKVFWERGNSQTGMGEYDISERQEDDAKHGHVPAFNLYNSRGIEVPTAFHGTPKSRKKSFNNKGMTNKLSHGCINCKDQDLKDLYYKHGLDVGDKVYILPEDEGNSVNIESDKIVFSASKENKKKYGKVGANVTTNKYFNEKSINSYQEELKAKGYLKGKVDGKWGKATQIAYERAIKDGFDPIQDAYNKGIKPLKIEINEEEFKKNVYNETSLLDVITLDTTDEEEFNNTTKPFVEALATNKSIIMKETGISNDAYNDIARVAFGIYGTESNYGDTHGIANNALKFYNKAGRALINKASKKVGWSNKLVNSSSSPDFQSKAEVFGINTRENSVGPTQIRWKWIEDNPDVKKQVERLGITNNMDLLDPKKAAIVTLLLLADKYKNQLSYEDKKDIVNKLPATWNPGRRGYNKRTARNSRYIKIRQKL